MLRFGLWLKVRFIAMSMVSLSGILVKKTSYIIGSKKFTRNIYILNLRNKRKSIFARVIIRFYRWKKITKETGKIIIKSIYRWNNRTKFRKCGTRGKLVLFGSAIYTSIRAGAEPEGCNLSYTFFVNKVFLFQLNVINIVVKLCVSKLGRHWVFRNLHMSKII